MNDSNFMDVDQLNQVNQYQLNALFLAVTRSLVAKGILRREDLKADLARQGLPAEFAFPIVKLIDEMPGQ